MLRKITLSLSLVLMAVLAVAPAAMAQDKVQGTFDLDWNACYEAPGEQVPDWVGTADIDGAVHDMVFFNVGTGRPPNHAVAAPMGSFNEIWAIYDDLELVFDEACALQTYEGDLVLWGLDHGTGNPELAEFQMTGTVEEGFGDYEGLAGMDISMSGTFFMGDDDLRHAPGTFEIG